MSKLTETVSDILAQLAEWIGLKSSEADKLDALEQKLIRARASNEDRLEALKDEIRTLEARVLQKKKEADAARGDIKRMIIREIEQIIRDLDRLRGRETIITANVERTSVAVAKIHELRAARDQGVKDDQLDEIALDLQEVFADLKEADRGVRELEKERYEGAERASVDVSQRVGEVEGSKVTAGEFSEATLKRLKEIEEG